MLLRVSLLVATLLFAAEVILYIGVSNYYRINAAELQLEITRQYIANVDGALKQAESLVLAHALLPEFRRFEQTFLNISYDFDRFLQIKDTLTTLASGANAAYIHSAYFYHHRSGKVFAGEGETDLEWFPDREYVGELLSTPTALGWDRPRVHGGTRDRVISFVARIPFQSRSDNLLVLNLSEEVFRVADIGPLLILTENESVVFQRDMSSEVLPALDAISASSTIRLDGQRHVVSVVESPYNGWRYVSKLPSSQVIRTQQNVVNFFVLLVVACLVGAILLSVFISRSSYEPILQFREALLDGSSPAGVSESDYSARVDEVAQIENRIRQIRSQNASYRERVALSQTILKEKSFWGLVTGRVDRAELSGISEEELNATGPFRVWIVDHPREIHRLHEVGLHFHDRVQELLGSRATLSLLDHHRTLAVVPVRSMRELSVLANALYDGLEEEFPFRFSLSIGQSVQTMFDLGTSFHDAQRLLSFRRIASGRAILWEGDTPSEAETYRLIESAATEFRRSLEYGRYDEARKAIDLICNAQETPSRYSYWNSKINECANALIAHTHLRMKREDPGSLVLSPWQGFQSLESIDEVKEWFRESFVRIERQVEESRGNTHRRIMEDAKSHILENYQTPLTAQAMADRYNISPNYFSTIFRREVGTGFSDYLHAIRMNHAMEALVSTPLSIVEIAARTGFGDKQNIIRAFKKEIGFSPSEYRRRQSAADGSIDYSDDTVSG